MAAAAGASSDGASSDCEGDDQEDSSSNSNELSLNHLSLQEEQIGDEALLAFRQQWQKELVSSPQRDTLKLSHQPLLEHDNDEDKAKQLFLCGVELERIGKLYEAVQHYKRAVQLLPDVETRLYQTNEPNPDTPEGTPEPKLEPSVNLPSSDEDDDEDSSDGNLLARLQKIIIKKGYLCEPLHAQKGPHISWLPYELIIVIIRWVVSSELDALSLVRTGQVCRGLYLASRDQDIWRTLCARTWGLNCGTPKACGFPTWMDMYEQRPRLRLNGCYISKTTYLRHGENSFQDQFYRPWYLIEYYRYLRFFPEGVVLMWTTAEDPAACVAHLKYRSVKNNLGIMSGHYRLVGDKVIIVVKKLPPEKKPAQTSNSRFRARRKDNNHDQQGQSFKLELQVKTLRSRRNWQLAWCGYSVCYRRDQWTNLEVHPNKFPPFAFSTVRQYTTDAEAPLA